MQGADLSILSEWQVLHNFEVEAEGVQILQKERRKPMSRYIDREDLLNNLKQFAPEYLKPLIVSLVEKQPTADVVEVVRCKDCRHYECFTVCNKHFCNDYGGFVVENDFCSRAEKKGEEE